MLFHKTLALVASFADKKQERWSKVCLTPNATAIATDAYKIARIKTKEPKPDSEFPKIDDAPLFPAIAPFTVNAEDLAHFVKTIKKNEELPVIECFAHGMDELISTNLETVKKLSITQD